MWQRGEANVVQLLPIEGAMEVATCRDGCGKERADSVNGLEGAFDVAAAGNLLDQDWG